MVNLHRLVYSSHFLWGILTSVLSSWENMYMSSMLLVTRNCCWLDKSISVLLLQCAIHVIPIATVCYCSKTRQERDFPRLYLCFTDVVWITCACNGPSFICFAISQLLLDNGADIHAKTNDGWCPLHSASRWNQAEALSLLLQCGANINAPTNSGQTALHIVSSDKESRQCLEILLFDSAIDISLKNSIGETAYDICQRTSENCLLFEIKEDSVDKLS